MMSGRSLGYFSFFMQQVFIEKFASGFGTQHKREKISLHTRLQEFLSVTAFKFVSTGLERQTECVDFTVLSSLVLGILLDNAIEKIYRLPQIHIPE